MQRLLLTGLVLVASASPLWAQTLDEVRPGTRLRLMIHEAREPLIGSLEETPTADTVRLRDSSGAVVSVSRSEIRRIDISRGRRGEAGKGAASGFLVGVGTAIPLAASCDCDQAAAGLVYGVLMGSIGSGFGALLGAFSKSERWQRLPLEPRAIQPSAPAASPFGGSSP